MQSVFVLVFVCTLLYAGVWFRVKATVFKWEKRERKIEQKRWKNEIERVKEKERNREGDWESEATFGISFCWSPGTLIRQFSFFFFFSKKDDMCATLARHPPNHRNIHSISLSMSLHFFSIRVSFLWCSIFMFIFTNWAIPSLVFSFFFVFVSSLNKTC